MPSGVVTASVALFGVGPVFGVTWTLTTALAALGALVVVALTTYCFALVLAALVLAAMDLRNVVSGIAATTTMLISGVMVPITFWPGWVQAVAQALPLTHSLAAIRTLADPPPAGVDAGGVLLHLLLAVGVGGVWLLLAAVLLERLAEVGRRSGTIEFAD
jgi:ABC-2 type transport system permease protein